MANRKKARRSRKRRPSTATSAGSSAFLAPQADPLTASPKKRAERQRPARSPDLSEDGRPRPPWHPYPLSEILVAVGAIAFVLGLRKLSHGGIASGGPTLLAGIGAALIGTAEFAWREHNGGFRSHTVLLTVIPVVFFHTAVVLGVSAFTRFPLLANIALLALDIALIAFLFRLLRARFIDAHRARVFEGRRSRR